MTQPSTQQFPTPQTPVVDKQGNITKIWQKFLESVWNRTGGANGSNGYFAFVNGAINQVFNVAPAITQTEAPPLSQVQSLDAAVLSASETFATGAANTAQANAETYTSTYYAPLASPALTGTPTAPTATAGTSTTQLATTAFATDAASTAQSNAETFATNAANTAQSNAETYALNQIQNGTGAAFSSITAGASPYTYTAAAVGHLLVSAGTVSAITLNRGSSSLTLPSVSGFIPLDNTDSVTITYSAAPTLNWIPR